MSSRPQQRPPAGMSARGALRDATSSAHNRLHEHSFFRPLTSGQADESSYRRILTGLYGFHAPLEEELVAAAARLGLEATMENRRRVPQLVHDLEDLGLSTDRIRGLLRLRWPEIDSFGIFFGTLYVREGSSLGGRSLARGLTTSVRARRFLSGCDGDGDLWKDLLEALEAEGRAGRLDEMVRGALETFEAMESWLSGFEEGNEHASE